MLRPTLLLACATAILAVGCTRKQKREPAPPPQPQQPAPPQFSQLPSIPPPGMNYDRPVSLSRAQVNRPLIALTYDDGPHPTNTPRLLDILKQRGVKATFYVVGTNARRYPGILRRMINEGHEIGNHTITHGNLKKMTNAQVRQELRGCEQAILSATGFKPRTMRPPYGAITPAQKSWIRQEFGYTTTLWSVDPRDWQRPGVGVVTSRLVNGAKPGAVLLAHDIHKPTIDATPGTISQLQARGFQFVTVSALLAAQSR